MADLFSSSDLQKLVDGKYILFFGDSNVRGLYKDVLTLYHKNKLISDNGLSRKLEKSFEGDSLLQSIGLTRGRNYKEHRRFESKGTRIEFFFITKCLCTDVSDTLRDVSLGKARVPDAIVMNSTLWDISRWGFRSVSLFKENINNLVQLFKSCLPESTLVIWLTTAPISNVKGAFLIPEVEYLFKHTVRFDAMEANMFAYDLFSASGYDVLDFHFNLRLNLNGRKKDGVHWHSQVVRYMTNLLLTHISIAWEKPLPGRFNSLQLDCLNKSLEAVLEEDSKKSVVTPQRAISSVKSEDRLETSSNPSKRPKTGPEDCLRDAKRPRLAVRDRLEAAKTPVIIEAKSSLGEINRPIVTAKHRLDEVSRPRISAKDRLGDAVDSLDNQQQEDLRTRLQNSSKTTNNRSDSVKNGNNYNRNSGSNPQNYGRLNGRRKQNRVPENRAYQFFMGQQPNHRKGRGRGDHRYYPSFHQKTNLRYNPHEQMR